MSARNVFNYSLLGISIIFFMISDDIKWLTLVAFLLLIIPIDNSQRESSKPQSPDNNRLKVMDDINGNPIYEGDTFTFEYVSENGHTYWFKGCFIWNQTELRYEIDIQDNQYYTCLFYNRDTMSTFKLHLKNLYD